MKLSRQELVRLLQIAMARIEELEQQVRMLKDGELEQQLYGLSEAAAFATGADPAATTETLIDELYQTQEVRHDEA